MIRFAGLLFLLTTASFGAEVIGYVFPQNAILNPADIAAEKLTIINYAFANLRNGQVVEGFSHDAQNFAFLNSLKARNPKLKILVSVGGWGWSGGFSDAALTPASRKVFVNSAVAFVTRYNLDGLDVDWEYPAMAGAAGNVFRPQDTENYTTLMHDLRHGFNKAEKKLGRRLYSTVAAGASLGFVAHTELKKVAKEVDFVNLMSYDYYEPTDDKIAAHHAPLYSNPADPRHECVDSSVKAYRAAGVPAKKLVVGVPFYGHAWTGGALYQKAVGAHIPADYNHIVSSLNAAAGYVRYWDPAASAPYLYNSTNKTFVSYDDVESLGLKCKYVRKNKLGGVMFWDWEGDSSGVLLDAIWRGVR